MARDFDVLLWGATGWTGVHLVEHFVTHYAPKGDSESEANSPKVSWALVARSEEKLAKIVEMIAKSHDAPWLKDVKTFIGDNDDEEAINKVVSTARAVTTVVGPYMKYGEKLLSSCVKNGTHYFDITGEASWVKQMIEKYEEPAKESGAYVMSFCGMDSVPSDLSTFLAVDAIRKEIGKMDGFDDAALSTLKTTVNGICLGLNSGSRGSGGGGGTMDTVISSVEAGEDMSGAKFTLSGKDDKCENDKNKISQRWVGRNSKIGSKNWTTNFPMAMINEKVVRRSRYLMNNLYGDDFSYSECMGKSNVFGALKVAIGLSIGKTLLSFGPTRRAVKKFLPKPSSVPQPKTKDDKPGWMSFLVLANSTITIGGEKKEVNSRVSFKTPDEAGWKYTAAMMTECALTVLNHREDVEAICGLPSGFITPACLGHVLEERLKKVGVEIEVKLD